MKGFLTTHNLEDFLKSPENQEIRQIKGFYNLTFKYFHKSKLFRIEHGNSFVYHQNDVEKLIRDLGYKDKTDFLHVFSKEFKLIHLHSEMKINLVCYKEFDNIFLRFVV
jgi:hypothetical protein